MINNIAVSSRLRRIDVPSGKYRVKFLRLIMISPGSRPIKGILSKNRRATPRMMMAAPVIIKILPGPLIIIPAAALLLF
jgi:hypothetical protein